MSATCEREAAVADGAFVIREATEFSGISRTSLYSAMDAGHLAYVKVNRRRLIPRAALKQFLADRLVCSNYAE